MMRHQDTQAFCVFLLGHSKVFYGFLCFFCRTFGSRRGFLLFVCYFVPFGS